MATTKKKSRPSPKKENIFQDGPYVVAAFLCELLLVEPDGVASAIRIVDRVTQTAKGPDPPETMPPLSLTYTLVIKLKTGKKPGKHQISIRLVDPRNNEITEQSQTVQLEKGENRGADIQMNLRMTLSLEGVYWFEVYCGDFLMVKTPLEVVYLIQRSSPVGVSGPVQ